MSRARDNANLSPTIADARMPNLTGDVTTVEGAVATTIANDAVTGAKIENNPTIAGNLTVSGDLVPSTPLSHRNIIINGAMNIFQRTAVNTEVVATSSGAFCADRFRFWSNVGSSLPEIQVRNDDAPAGFLYSLKRTTNSASSIAASSYDSIIYRIEGNDVAHLNYGTANAKTLTLSFYVKCSIAGTFSITFDNQAHNRGLVKEYTIDATNTWKRKEITFTGDTSGTWTMDNNKGFNIYFNQGYGSNYSTSTLNSWQASVKYASTGATTAVATTNGATFLLTGVQLELGSNATPFEHRSYGDELARCQRYYVKTENTSGSDKYFGILQVYAVGSIWGHLKLYPGPGLRSPPNSVTQSGTFGAYKADSADAGVTTAIGNLHGAPDGWSSGGWGSGSGLTPGHASNTKWENGAYLTADAEL